MRLFLNCGRGRKRRGYWSGNKTISAQLFGGQRGRNALMKDTPQAIRARAEEKGILERQ